MAPHSPAEQIGDAASINQIDFMEDTEEENDIDWDGFHIESVADSPVMVSLPACSRLMAGRRLQRGSTSTKATDVHEKAQQGSGPQARH